MTAGIIIIIIHVWHLEKRTSDVCPWTHHCEFAALSLDSASGCIVLHHAVFLPQSLRVSLSEETFKVSTDQKCDCLVHWFESITDSPRSHGGCWSVKDLLVLATGGGGSGGGASDSELMTVGQWRLQLLHPGLLWTCSQRRGGGWSLGPALPPTGRPVTASASRAQTAAADKRSNHCTHQTMTLAALKVNSELSPVTASSGCDSPSLDPKHFNYQFINQCINLWRWVASTKKTVSETRLLS